MATAPPEPGPDAGKRQGRIVLVGTPIGNLGDLSARAVAALAAADVIACEDTRVTRKLLSNAGVRGRPLVALHAHNEASAAEHLVAQAAAGAVVAAVTDAGMPAVSDPGARLVAAAVAAGVAVDVVPGPSAALAALAVSGLATDRFSFEGFLPRKGKERSARLAGIAADSRTVIVFEAPPRLRATLSDLLAACGPDRPVAVARELTKLHQEVWRGRLGGADEWLAGREPRGEYVLVLGPPPAVATAPLRDEDLIACLAGRLAGGEDRKAAVAAVASELGVPRRRVYQVALDLKNRDSQRKAPR